MLPWLQSKSISRGDISRSVAVTSAESVDPSSCEVRGEHPSRGGGDASVKLIVVIVNASFSLASSPGRF